MKKCLCVMLAILLLLATSGCGEEDLQPQVYEKPTFTPGVMESELLAEEPGNFERICNTGNGDYLEIETGYYVNWWGSLFYAEKSDPDTWFYVCSEPECSHTGYDCSASISSNSVCYYDGRIFFVDALSEHSQFWPKGELQSGDVFLSMAQNGNDIKMEDFYDECAYDGGVTMNAVVPGGYLLAAAFLLPDGTYEHLVYLYRIGEAGHPLWKKTENDMNSDISVYCGLHKLRIGGDLTVQSSIFTSDADYRDTLCWFHNGEPVFTDISEVPAWGGYLQGNIIRCFDPGKGYYDIDLLTGERTKLADAQLDNSKARILQPNCIIETTLLNPESAVGTQEMRFFDGQQWHSVQLPDDLFAPDDTFEVVALASDRVIFSVKRHGMITSYYGEDASVIFYQMKLDGETYTVEPMGTFQKPTGTGLADQP